MKISGFQKTTLLDYPGKVACTVFLNGCNFRCPFCHNADLVIPESKTGIFTENEIFEYLKKRKGILDGVCITGGEPLLNKEISEFMKRIKEMGLLVKLDTNGSFPERLEEIISAGVVDYVAMDIKNSFEKYSETSGLSNKDLTNIKRSIDLIMEEKTDYEFRTTVVREFHTVEDIKKIAKTISGAKRYFLQAFVDSGHLIGQNLHVVPAEEMNRMKAAAKEYVEEVCLRGV